MDNIPIALVLCSIIALLFVPTSNAWGFFLVGAIITYVF